jgi:tripartite-type tricarboxylate transporter receptor subunit TctC
MRDMRVITTMLTAVLAVCAAAPAAAQNYPTRPIRLVTAPIGGGNDFVARMVAQALSPRLGQQLVVDNRPTTVVPELVAKAAPDGYTLATIGSSFWLAPFLQESVNYDPIKDFAPIYVTGRSVNLLVVHPAVAAQSTQDLIALARAKPGQINYATGATGTSNHLAAELFKYMAKVDMVRIGYKGSGPAVNDLISGQVQLMFPTTAAGLPHVRSGRLRALAVTSLERTTLAPGLPTVAESGLPGYESLVVYALLAPAKTPASIISRLHTEVAQGLKTPAISERLLSTGVEVVASSPDDLAKTMQKEMSQLGKLIKDAKLR